MKRCWEPTKVTSVFIAKSEKEYKQRLAEIAEVLYDHFSQQCQSQFIEPCNSSQSSREFEMKRTGSDGQSK